MKTADIIAMLGLQNEMEAEHTFVISILTELTDIKKALRKIVNKDNRFVFVHFLNAVKEPVINHSLTLYIFGGNRSGVVTYVMYNTVTRQLIK